MSSTDLELHGIRCRMRGFPIYNDYDELVGIMDEPDWEWDALTQEQQAEVRQLAVRLQKGDRSWDECFPFALGEFGVACPHKWENHEPTWRECRWCHVAEQLSGHVVHVAGRTFRFEGKPPPVLRIPVSVGHNGPIIDEYWWDGSRYRHTAGVGSYDVANGVTDSIQSRPLRPDESPT